MLNVLLSGFDCIMIFDSSFLAVLIYCNSKSIAVQ